MYKKKNGFIAVECILSLAIISIAAYIVSSSLQDNYLDVNNNAYKLDMLNIAKSKLENIKYDIKYGKEYENNTTIEEIDSYQVVKNVQKQEKYYQCYKVSIEVKNDAKSIGLTSYVFQQ